MQIIRSSDITRLTGLSRTTLWRLERLGKFPARVRLGVNSVGWRSDEIESWIDHRPRGMTNPAATSRSYHSARGSRG